MAGRPSTCSQNGIGGRSAKASANSGGGGSRNDGQSAGPGTSGIARSVNSNPAPSGPNTATDVCPTSAPAARVVATACVARRPWRRTVTSTITGPAGTWAAKTVVIVRRRWLGSPISAAIAAAVTAVIVPP